MRKFRDKVLVCKTMPVPEVGTGMVFALTVVGAFDYEGAAQAWIGQNPGEYYVIPHVIEIKQS